MKKSALLLLLCVAFAGCAKNPGRQETGYRGVPWGADAKTVAGKLGFMPTLVSADSMFASHYQGLEPRLGVLLKKGFCKLSAGNSGADLNAAGALQGLSALDDGQDGYSLFFNKRFGMNLHTIPVKEYRDDHDKLMKRYGVIDKKLEYRANEYESSYLIMWHNADGVIILAKETYTTHPPQRVTSAQIIHMDKHVFDEISGELSKGNKQG